MPVLRRSDALALIGHPSSSSASFRCFCISTGITFTPQRIHGGKDHGGKDHGQRRPKNRVTPHGPIQGSISSLGACTTLNGVIPGHPPPRSAARKREDAWLSLCPEGDTVTCPRRPFPPLLSFRSLLRDCASTKLNTIRAKPLDLNQTTIENRAFSRGSMV